MYEDSERGLKEERVRKDGQGEQRFIARARWSGT